MRNKIEKRIKKAYERGKVEKELELLAEQDKFFVAGYRARECGLFKKTVENFEKSENSHSNFLSYFLKKEIFSEPFDSFREISEKYVSRKPVNEKNLHGLLNDSERKFGAKLPDYIKFFN